MGKNLYFLIEKISSQVVFPLSVLYELVAGCIVLWYLTLKGGDIVRELLEQMGNKQFAFECMTLLERHNVPIEVIRSLTDGRYCKERFNSRKAILKEVRTTVSTEDIFDNTSKARFYSEAVHYNGHHFLITNYWYGPTTNQPDNRTPFMEWVLQRCTI